MSKSKGNFYTLNDIIKKGMSVEEFRYMIFSAHYRSKINFSLKRINNAKKAVESKTQEEMSKLTGDLKLPPGIKLPF